MISAVKLNVTLLVWEYEIISQSVFGKHDINIAHSGFFSYYRIRGFSTYAGTWYSKKEQYNKSDLGPQSSGLR